MKHYAFYVDSFDWGVTTDEAMETTGETALWEECRSLSDAKKCLADFFAERIAENKRMLKCARKINRGMVAHRRSEEEAV